MMVVVLMGSFMMGSPEAEAERFNDEDPQHRVTIEEPFAIGVHEVTFDEWAACVAAGGCNGYEPDDEGWGRGQLPVGKVSWDDAQAYAQWLAAETGEAYRLPSEAEWEYAARAGTTTPFSFGETISAEQASYDGTRAYGAGAEGEFRGRTMPVGSFPANAFGLHDVHGNAAEWVEDCYVGNDYVGAPSDGSAATSASCEQRVMRGGNALNHPHKVRSAFRGYDPPYSRALFKGLRVARDLN